MALSQIVDVEVNPADGAGVRIRYKLGTTEFSIALSALYQLLLLNPQRGAPSCPGPGHGFGLVVGLQVWPRGAAQPVGQRAVWG